MDAKGKPHFVIIGAVKAATTWTARQLAQHPSIFIPGPEPHYFSSEYERGPDWYSSFFADAPAGAVIGEKSADYLAHPMAAERIASDLPEARLVVQLRNPIERAYSDYCMLYRRGTTQKAPGAYFSERQDGDGFGARFLSGGLYAEHLARFLDRFAREQLLVLLYEGISDEPRGTLIRIAEHIGIDGPASGPAMARENDGAARMLPLPMRKALRPFKKAAAPLRGQDWFKSLRGIFARQIAYPPLEIEARNFLSDYYRSDIKELGAMIGRDLSPWLSPPAPAASNGYILDEAISAGRA